MDTARTAALTSLWMACLGKVCQFLECSIDESCNLMILFKPSWHSKLLQMDSFWPELHDHSNGWDSEGSGFSLVLSNSKENREKPSRESRTAERKFFVLTLLVAGMKIYVKWQGVFTTPPSEHQKLLWKPPPKKIFVYQIGHIEIGKVIKFGGIWR